MCGIFALLCCHPDCGDCQLRHQVDLSGDPWSNRGPDGFGCASAGPLMLAGCVLHLRGPQVVRQPTNWEGAGGQRRLLLWNGELFACTDPRVNLVTENDTEVVARMFSSCGSLEELLIALGSLSGPHAYFYYAPDLGLALFGRDLFGRRSLLVSSGHPGHLAWSSIDVTLGAGAEGRAEWSEVSAFGAFSLDLATLEFTLHPCDLYDCSDSGAASEATLCGRPVRLDRQRGVRRFTVDAAAVRAECPAASRGGTVDGPPGLGDAPACVASEVPEFERLLSEAVACRVLLCCCAESSGSPASAGQAAVAVLFSGGVDSTVLAALATRHAPERQSIDLLNVAFEQAPAKANLTVSRRSRQPCSQRPAAADPFNVPDRATGIESVQELRRLFPGRVFNFVTIDVTLSELQQTRTRRISRLCRPCNTVLDDSLGCAVWFAARGVGALKLELNPHLLLAGHSADFAYRSPAKVVLCGMGADELLCGYSRHRYIYTQHGYPAVADEVTMELKRIAQRNLGRDDRVIADHGREARFPYLDERLVSYLANLPPWKKADLSRDRGLGEKLLLRLCASRLGLVGAAVRPKRAMQFGSRIAKCESRRERGGEVCDRLLDCD